MATLVGYHNITDQDHWLQRSFPAEGGSVDRRHAVEAPEQKAFVAWLETVHRLEATYGQRSVSGPSSRTPVAAS